MGVFEHAEDETPEGREWKVLLGDGERVFAQFYLNPETLEPVPYGLEDRVPAPSDDVSAEQVYQDIAEQVPNRFALSAKVVPEPEGYKLLLVYEGRIVGEMHLDLRLEPKSEAPWLEEFRRSEWKYP